MKKELLSSVLSQVPLYRHTDGNRLQMAANHHVQALPLVDPEVPYIYVPTNLHHSMFAIRSPFRGRILDLVKNVYVIEDERKEVHLLQFPFFLNPVRNLGEEVEIGSLLAVHNSALPLPNGEYVMPLQGKNVYVGANIFDGFTSDDALVVDTSFAEAFESISYDRIEIELDGDWETIKFTQFPVEGEYLRGKVAEIYSKQFALKKLYEVYAPLDKFKVKHIFVYVNKKLRKRFLNTLPEAERAFFEKHLIESVVKSVPENLPPEKKAELKALFKSIASGSKAPKIYVLLLGEIHAKTRVGDKFTNRFGNKGVVSKILDLPPVKIEVGDLLNKEIKIQFLFSPDGIRRMNLSQLGEMHYAFLLKDVVPKLLERSLKINSKELALEKLFKTFALDELGIKQLEAVARNLGADKLIQIILKEGLHLPVNNLENAYALDKIAQLTQKLGVPEELRLHKNKRTAFGLMYIHQLEHRAVKKYSAVSVDGKGQRIGEQETWALIASDQYSFIKESIIRSDNPESHLAFLQDLLYFGINSKDLEQYLEEHGLSDVVKQFKTYLLSMGVNTFGPEELDLSYTESYWKWKQTQEEQLELGGEE